MNLQRHQRHSALQSFQKQHLTITKTLKTFILPYKSLQQHQRRSGLLALGKKNLIKTKILESFLFCSDFNKSLVNDLIYKLLKIL